MLCSVAPILLFWYYDNSWIQTAELEEQERAVLAHGAFLDYRYKHNLYTLLYQINSFYIEVYIHQKENRILVFSSFTDIDNLEPYLKKIDITSLLQAF